MKQEKMDKAQLYLEDVNTLLSVIDRIGQQNLQAYKNCVALLCVAQLLEHMLGLLA